MMLKIHGIGIGIGIEIASGSALMFSFDASFEARALLGNGAPTRGEKSIAYGTKHHFGIAARA